MYMQLVAIRVATTSGDLMHLSPKLVVVGSLAAILIPFLRRRRRINDLQAARRATLGTYSPPKAYR